MTTRTGSVSPSNSSDAYFRAWGKWISDSFSAFGWVQTSDTGQVNWTTVTYPTTTWTVQGYEIWRMNDSLQGTAPIFVKVEYGSAGTATFPWIAFTLGTGSDGAGNITGQLHGRTQVYSGNQSTTGQTCYASGSSNRFALVMFKAAASYAFVLCIERTHDATGADTNTGFQVFHFASSGAVWGCKQSHFSGSNPTTYAAWNHSQLPPTGSGAQTPDIHCYPIRCWTPGESFPSLNVVAYVSADFADGSTYSVTGYDGVSRSYVAIGSSYPGNLNGDAVRQAGRFMLRYE